MSAFKHKGLSNDGAHDADLFVSIDVSAGFLASNIPLPAAVADSKATPVTGALTINGTSDDDTLVITATDTSSGTYCLNGGPAIAFNNVTSVTFNGGNGNDNVTVKNPDGGLFAPVDGVFVHGGTQNAGTGDGLAIEGGTTDTAIYSTDAHHADGKDGSIVLSHGAVTATYTYTGLEPLANTGSAANIVFNLPAGADAAFLEDDGIPDNNTSQLRSANGTFETTVFTNPTGSLTINSGTGDTVTVNLVDALNSANLTIGSLTNSANNPNSIAVNDLATTGRVILAATGAIAESGNDPGIDVTAGQLDLLAGTGIGVGNKIETVTGNLEAQTNTGGIFLTNTAASLYIGGQSGVPTLTGLKVVTSGNIDIETFGSIVLADDDGTQTVLGGSVSGDVLLTANGSSSDFYGSSLVTAIRTPAGRVDVEAGRDIRFLNDTVQNDVLADQGIFFIAGRDVFIGGEADIVADAFGHHTGGGVGVLAGPTSSIGQGNVTISNDKSIVGNRGASVGTGGRGDVLIHTGFGNANVFTNQGSVFSTAGDIDISSNSPDLQAGSSITANQGRVKFAINTGGVDGNLGSTAAGFNFSQAELDTISAHALRIQSSRNITISQSITLDPAKVPTLTLEASFASSAGNAGAIIDGTAGEQADLTVKNLLLKATGSIGAADDIDVQVQNLAFDNSNPFNVASPAVNISNIGALTIAPVATATGSQNTGSESAVSATGPLTIAANVTSGGQLVLQTIDSAAAGENLTVRSGATVHADGLLFLFVGDDLDLQAGSTLQSPDPVRLVIDDDNADPGTGATANLNGSLLSPTTRLRDDLDADTFNVTPSATSPILISAIASSALPGATLTVTTAGTTNPTLTISSVSDVSKTGEYHFGNRQPVQFTDIESLNTIDGPLTVNGSGLNDLFSALGPGTFSVTGPYVRLDNFGDDSATTVDVFGVVNTATYGQVITADATHSKLSGFTFEMNLPNTVAFRGEVYAWDGTKAMGPALFESAVMSTAGTGNQLITFNTGGITLTPGQQYVLFASTSKDQAGHSGLGSWDASGLDTYSGGQFVYLNNGNDASQWTTQAWSSGTGVGIPDLEFTASFRSEERRVGKGCSTA